LAYDIDLDLATYDLSEIQVNAARADVHYAPVWPPVIDETDLCVVGGWPWALGKDRKKETDFQFLHFIAGISSSSERQLSVFTSTSSSVAWGRNALQPGTNLGGMSGGPIYRLSEKGLSTVTLIGVTFEYGPVFETALARPLSCVGADGDLIW
jgi:hypothetical protein